MNMLDSGDKEVDYYYPKDHALIYYKKMLEGLLARVDLVREKIAVLEGRE